MNISNSSTISHLSNAAPAAPARKAIEPPATRAAARADGTAAINDTAEPNPQQLPEAVKRINTVLQVRAPGLEFSVDSDSARAIVKVIDTNTNEVIRQMPSKEALEIAKALEHLDSLLIRDKA